MPASSAWAATTSPTAARTRCTSSAEPAVRPRAPHRRAPRPIRSGCILECTQPPPSLLSRCLRPNLRRGSAPSHVNILLLSTSPTSGDVAKPASGPPMTTLFALTSVVDGDGPALFLSWWH